MDRNEKLDTLKGLASVLMLLAHNTIGTGHFERRILFFGGMAPVFFFAISGIVLADYQLKKKPRWELLLYYLVFFFLGFAYNDVWTVRDKSVFWSSNILQEIALSSIIIVLLSRRFDVRKLAWCFPLPFFIHLAAPYLPAFPLKTFFFRPPGLFPVFPWLAFFLLGILCRRTDALKLNSCYKIIPVGLLLACAALGPGYGIKWNMNTAYFIVSSVIFAAVYFLADDAKVFPFRRQFIFLGKNSLLFLFLHLLARDIITRYTTINPVLWLGSLILSFFGITLLIRLNALITVPEKLWPGIWAGLLVLIAVIPFLPHNAGYTLAYAAGFYISLNYGKLNLLVRFIITAVKYTGLTGGSYTGVHRQQYEAADKSWSKN